MSIDSKRLYRLKSNNINNIMFTAGISHTEQMFWCDIFNEVVNGKIINYYTKNDNVFKKLLEPCVKKKPIGWNKLIINEDISIKIENYEMTDFKLDLYYNDNFEEVLKKVNL